MEAAPKRYIRRETLASNLWKDKDFRGLFCWLAWTEVNGKEFLKVTNSGILLFTRELIGIKGSLM